MKKYNVREIIESERYPLVYRSKQQLLIVVAIAMIILGIVMTSLNLVQGEFKLGITTFVIVVLGVIDVVLMHYFKKLMTAQILTISVILVLFSWYLVSGAAQGFSVLWFLVIPPIAMYITGVLLGTIYTLMGEITLILFFWGPCKDYITYHYTDAMQSRFPILYFAISMLSFGIAFQVACYHIDEEHNRIKLEREVSKEKNKNADLSMEAIIAIANTVDAKDAYSKQHSLRVAEYVKKIAQKLNWSLERIDNIYRLALLHDVGKISISDSLLNKTGKLSVAEYELIKQHVIKGSEIIESMTAIEHITEGVRYHHEWFDGTGYCEGLKGKEIPIEARIIAVADAFDAMSSNRAYRKALPKEKVVEELEKGKGTQFDPKLANIMIGLIEEMYKEDAAFIKNKNISGSGAWIERVMTGLQENAEEQYGIDDLTGLITRGRAKQIIDEHLETKSNQGAFFIMDLDNFKYVNDSYGHVKGDTLLKDFAKCVQDVVPNDLLCRLGGDEFIVFIKNQTDREVLEDIAKQFCTLAKNCVKELQIISNVGVTVGIAVARKDGNTFEELYINADRSLYYAKKKGKNTYSFYANSEEQMLFLSENMDIDVLIHLIDKVNTSKGAFGLEYGDFQNIYTFLQRNLSRTKQNIQVVLFNIEENNGGVLESDMLENAVRILIHSINISLRNGDIMMQFSASQVATLLIGSNHDNGIAVANRILQKYKRNAIAGTKVTYTMRVMKNEN